MGEEVKHLRDLKKSLRTDLVHSLIYTCPPTFALTTSLNGNALHSSVELLQKAYFKPITRQWNIQSITPKKPN